MTFLHYERASRPTTKSDVSLPEVLGMLSHALDLTEGQPTGHALRCSWIAANIGTALNMTDTQLADLVFTTLIKDAGCSANASRVAALFQTDDITFKNRFKLTDTRLISRARLLLQTAARSAPLMKRVKLIMDLIPQADDINCDLISMRCNRGAKIAARLNFSQAVQDGILSLDEHWDGTGTPLGQAGDAVPIQANIALMAQVIDVFFAKGGQDAATRVVARRSGTWFAPNIAAAFQSIASESELWAVMQHPDVGKHVFTMPFLQKAHRMNEELLDDIAGAFADIIDAKSPFTADHSRRVAHYADVIAHELGLSKPHRRWLARAALLHDIGKLAVSNTILDKPGALSDAEWVSIRQHPVHSELLLRQVRAFSDIAPIAGAHHERLDGTGYPHGLKSADISLETRILSVADVFDALSADRPYRQAMPLAEVYRILKSDIGTALDGDCVYALQRGMQRNNTRVA